jgi:TDG/mug DNA glycosylase family protein
MGAQVETLEDLLRPGLKAVCVGINPSPVSVTAGHYFQGRAGQRFFERLRAAGVLPDRGTEFEDDVAFAAGIGFTDVIKRPTPNAKALPASELQHGRDLLVGRLKTYAPGTVIFVFKKAAETLLGKFAGNGFVPGLTLGTTPVFIMPGPYENKETAAARMRSLAEHWRAAQA